MERLIEDYLLLLYHSQPRMSIGKICQWYVAVAGGEWLVAGGWWLAGRNLSQTAAEGSRGEIEGGEKT
jgi:hypothetical protein